LILTNLFGKGFGGSVLVGIAKVDSGKEYHHAFKKRVGSSYESRITYIVDEENSNFEKAMDHLTNLSPYRMYGAGISANIPGKHYSAIRKAANNFHWGSLSAAPIIWTLDSADSMDIYLTKGARSIMTNDPALAVDRIRNAGLHLTPVGEFPSRAISQQSYKYPGNTCDCKWSRPKGSWDLCVISTPAPRFYACQCFSVGTGCEGSVVECIDPKAYCEWPDTSHESCRNAGPQSNCGGY